MRSPRKLTLSTKLYFGKYKDLPFNSVYDIIRNDPKYVEWLINIWEGEIDPKVIKMAKHVISNID